MKRIITALLAGTALLTTVVQAHADDFENNCISEFGEYDKIMLKRSKGRLTESDSVAMVGHLKSALDNFRSWRSEKGDSVIVSDEMAKAMGAHYNDFTVVGIFMFQDQDYSGAYDLWEACVEIPDDAKIGGAIKNMQNARGQIAYNRAIAATQAGMNEKALASYDKAYELGYHDSQLFDSAIMMAQQARDRNLAYKWAQRGVEKVGPTSVYREYMIKFVTDADPSKGIELCSETIAIEPANPKWYNLRVVANEKLKNHEASKEDLKRITELSPDDPIAFYNYGSKLMFLANIAKNEKTAKKDELKLMYAEATAALEAACQKSNVAKRSMPAVIKSINALDQFYHSNGDKAGRKRVEEYRKKFGITK